jgi:N-acetyl-alpha-D-muramate 1-phosphate uridylyltransferase
MKAMILAAGRGARMGELTTKTPKPLLSVFGKPLIVWHIEKLVAAGITDLVINHAWLGNQIENQLGNGQSLGARIVYSPEAIALETAGAIATALPLLQTLPDATQTNDPFAVISADIFSEFSYHRFEQMAQQVSAHRLHGACVMVENPDHHATGDFAIDTDRLSWPVKPHQPTYTYSGISVLTPLMFRETPANQFEKLVTLFRRDAPKRLLLGERYFGPWSDVGTPERLAQLQTQ